MKRKNMKTKILSQIAALMALGVATQGCSDNWTADVGGEGVSNECVFQCNSHI